jgi:hypothetical protein
MAFAVNSESLSAVVIGVSQRAIRLLHNSSNFVRVKSFSKCFGPSGVTEINGKLIDD